MLITFEGIDGCGKSTQATLLADRLHQENIETLLLREPGGTELSEHIRALLLHKEFTRPLCPEAELLLFAASRAQLIHEVIKPALERGAIVILDRFTDSTIAYQGFGRGIALDIITQINRLASNEIEPDLTFLFDISLKVASARRESSGKDRIESESEVFYTHVIQGYMYQAQHHNERMNVLDGTAPIETLQHQIWRLFQEERGRDIKNAHHLDQ